jgi:hypothetical protein
MILWVMFTLLLCQLDRIAEQDLKIKISKLSSWPKSPGSLSRKIPQIKTLLRGAGIVIERPVETGTDTKLIEIHKYPRNHLYPRKIKIKRKNRNPAIPGISGIFYICIQVH